VTPAGNGSFSKVNERATGGGMHKRRMKMGSMATLVIREKEKEIIAISSLNEERWQPTLVFIGMQLIRPQN
jgi:hypothetical protein